MTLILNSIESNTDLIHINDLKKILEGGSVAPIGTSDNSNNAREYNNKVFKMSDELLIFKKRYGIHDTKAVERLTTPLRESARELENGAAIPNASICAAS